MRLFCLALVSIVEIVSFCVAALVEVALLIGIIALFAGIVLGIQLPAAVENHFLPAFYTAWSAIALFGISLWARKKIRSQQMITRY